MNEWQTAVQEFHCATGQANGLDTLEKRELRARLIMEEAVETVAALGFLVQAGISDGYTLEHVATFDKEYPKYNDLDFIDGLCDLIYVTVGGAVNRGINLDRHFREVHNANMRKLAGEKRADGKQLKPEGWVGPDHQRVLDTYYPIDEEGLPHG